MSGDPAAPHRRDTLLAWTGYFLRLGAIGFGGPVALVGRMQQDLVDTRGWVSRQDYLDGLALAQLSPGPLAAQLAMYLGRVRAGVAGATLVGAAVILPSFVMVLAIAAAYQRAGGMPWIQAAFYGIGAAVIAIIARSVIRLTRLTLARDPWRWAIMLVNAAVTVATRSEVIWAIVASGLALMAWRARGRVAAPALLAVVPVATPPLHAVTTAPTLMRIITYFATAGAFVFGSGLAIVPFLHGGVVEHLHWLDERQFLDAVAVAMITPGPVVITVAFIGFLVAGWPGALAAAVGVFVPCYLFVVALASHFRRLAAIGWVRDLVAGITAAATGAIAGAVVVLGTRAVVDVPTFAIAGAAWLVLARWRLPEPAVILGAAAAGSALRAFGR